MNQAATLNVTTAGTNDFVLTDADFNRIRELVREHTGIALSAAKRQMVYGRLARRLRALRLASFADYVEFLERAEPLELQEFTNAITTNLTSFFRESHHFDYLAEHVLPHIAARAGAAGLDHAERHVAGATREIEQGEVARALGRIDRGHQRVLPGPVQAARHQVVHQVVTARDALKHVVDQRLLVRKRHLARAERGRVCHCYSAFHNTS